MQNKNKKGQIAFEYIIIMGFVTLVLTITIGIALTQSSNVNSQMKNTQLINCANKIIGMSEQIFYAGEPSKTTITCYLPNNIKNVEILNDNLVITFQTNTGENKLAFPSNVPINGTLTFNEKVNKIQIIATENYADIYRI